jgi:hypothetical protein
VTRTPRRCAASTRKRESPSPENSTIWPIILGELHGIDGELDVHVTLHPAPAAGFDEFCSLPRRIIRYGADKSSKKSALSAVYLAVGRLLSEPSMTTFPSFVHTHHRHVVRPRFFKIT